MSCLVPGHPRYPRQDQLLEGACHRGRYGCGKSVAVHEALRGLPGTFVHGEERRVEVQPSQAPEFGWAGHAQRALQSGAAELQKDPEASSKVPILVLDIPRKTTEGVPLSFWSLLQFFPRPRCAAGVEFCEGDVLGPAGRCCARGGPGTVLHARSAHRGLKYEPRSSFAPPPQAQR